jgi:hypothetical protein
MLAEVKLLKLGSLFLFFFLGGASYPHWQSIYVQRSNFWSNAPAFGIAQLWIKERTTTDRSN